MKWVIVLCAGVLCAQSVPSRTLSKGSQRIEIVLEKGRAANWQAVDPQSVFRVNDRVRFRFRTNFDGYLYVLNRASSGGFHLIFPAAGAGRDNRVEANRDYMLPREAGSFEITGKPGFDVLYWVVSPVALDPGSPAPPPVYETPRPKPLAPALPSNLIPRCDDSILRARGECVDVTAGPQSLGEQTTVPRSWQVSMLRSRDLVFIREAKQSVVESSTPITEPVIYEYRIAHR